MTRPTNTLEAALAYAARGWRVFPVRCRAKTPLTAHGFNDATTDRTTICAWLEKWPSSNLGIATGGGLMVIDVDPHHGGHQSLEVLEQKYGSLPRTMTARSGGGGLHIFLATNGHQIRSSASKLGAGLDVRAEGGYIVGAPSVHESGGVYEWLQDDGLAMVPDWVAEALTDQQAVVNMVEGSTPEGQRNVTLMSLAGTMRRRGMSVEAIEAALLKENRLRCLPPLDDDEVRAIARSAGRYSPNAGGEGDSTGVGNISARFSLTDGGNADRFAQQHAVSLRYCTEQGVWYGWDGKRWLRNAIGEVMRRARETAISIYGEARTETDKERREKLAVWAVQSESRNRLEAMVVLARYHAAIEVQKFEGTFDCEPFLLNCENGIVDLRSGGLGPHRRAAMMTKLAPVGYDPDVLTTAFVDFLAKTFRPMDPSLSDEARTEQLAEMIEFIQCVGGYFLSGSTKEREFYLANGPTGTGKSTLVRMFHGLMGDYAVAIPNRVLLAKHPGQKDYDTWRLAGARLATTVETAAGRKLDEEIIKAITGQDTLHGERKHENTFTFKSQAKLLMATNHLPAVRDTDDAIWRRIKPIEFAAQVPDGEVIDRFEEKLIATEGPGILAWFVKGCQKWQKEGLHYPKKVTEDAQTYRNEQDEVHIYIGERCITVPRDDENYEDTKTTAKDLYADYAKWSKDSGQRRPSVSKTGFGKELKRLGFRPDATGGTSRWCGLRLRTIAEEADG